MKKLYKINQYTEDQFNRAEDEFAWPEDEILIIEKRDAYCMDITAHGKRIVPILRKIEESMAGLAGENGVYAGWFGEWANSLTNRQDRKYFIWNYSGRNGCWSYSWGIEKLYDGLWYIFLNIAKPQEETPTDNDVLLLNGGIAMTRFDVMNEGYDKHHESYHRGYVSRKSDVNALPAEPYNGRFGTGYIVDTPCTHSTQYCIREYWIACQPV